MESETLLDSGLNHYESLFFLFFEITGKLALIWRDLTLFTWLLKIQIEIIQTIQDGNPVPQVINTAETEDWWSPRKETNTLKNITKEFPTKFVRWMCFFFFKCSLQSTARAAYIGLSILWAITKFAVSILDKIPSEFWTSSTLGLG